MHNFCRNLFCLLAGLLILGACQKPVIPDDPIDDPTDDPVTPVDPTPGPDEPTFGIADAADLVAFADSVNAGKPVDRFCVDGKVVLLNDIDMSEVTAWTPIGNPSSVSNGNTACEYTGTAFTAVFDGQDHTIYNFKVSAKLPAASTWGLFGLVDGGTVQNVKLGKEGDSSCVTVSAEGVADAGILVGTAFNGAVIQNCENNIPLVVNGTTASARFSSGCFVGYACSTAKAVSLNTLVNNARVTMSAGSNTANGATGVMVGGIVGFCTGSGTELTMVESCENKGSIEGACGRSSGIAATMNAKTFMRYCVNRGNQLNTFTNGRVGNLTCIMGSGCMMDDCTNYGDVVTSDPATTTAGMIALLNNANVVVTGGGNYGKVISGNSQYHGLLVANFSAFSSFSGAFAGGACGTYSADGKHQMHDLTADTWISHIGYYSSSNFAKITELSSPFGAGGGTGVTGTVPDFKDASLKILFIGNSFTKDAVEHLPGLIKGAGITDVTLAHCYYGGRTIPEYNNGWNTSKDYTLYYMNAGGSSWTTYSDKVTIKDVAESGRWDIVTIQEHTGNYRAWAWTEEEKTAIQGLLDKCAATQQVKPKSYYVMSQAYFNMGKIASGSKPYITWTDQAGMFSVIVTQTRTVLAQTSVDDVLATGTMLQNLRTSGLDNEMNLTRDGYHMDYGASRYGAACVMFEKLITPKFNKNLDGNTYRYANSSQVEGSYSTPVTDENFPVILKAARYAIEKPFEVTDMKGEGGSTGGGDTPETPSVELGGSGTEADPYLITKAEEMKGIAPRLVEGQMKYFRLTADIDMGAIKDWTPVNTANKAMGMDFDGGNHTISNFSCTNQNYASLFGLIHGSVKDLKIDKPSVTHSSQCGILATWIGNSAGTLSATISNVHITDASLKTTATAAACLGMISANAGASTITGCSATGAISHSLSSGSWTYVGGLVGRMYISGSIERCSYDGTITTKGGYGYAGILGGTGADVAVSVKDCWSAGSITGGNYCGGIVAELCKGSSVLNCYSTMSMSGVYNFGGIVGRASNAKNPNSAGTFNTDINITVKGCVAWNPSITSTKASSETPATHYSSGAVVGFTTYLNVLNSCWRRPDMTFQTYSIEALNTLVDTPDVGPASPLVKTSSETFFCPYNGKAAAAGETVSSIATKLGWDASVWDLSGDYPKLK
ncbi:MAG: DUF4886 domain-containing protein [Bacteroidales bacterium]|nr:DUF4886 domain-containing protein [Bacteroidales bacterium]